MQQDLLDIQTILNRNKAFASFSGNFFQYSIEEMGQIIRRHMECERKPKREIFNLFSVFIEQTQNIKNYLDSVKETPLGKEIQYSGIVCIGKSEEGYFVRSGNIIENKDIPKLKEKLDLIEGKSKEELKQLYKEYLKKDFIPGERGAGLGLIEIARRASRPVRYSFFAVREQCSFFEINVIV